MAGIAVLASLVSLYYYLIMIKSMYVDVPEQERAHADITVRWPMWIVIILSILMTIALGIYPDPLVNQLNEISDLLK